MRAIELEGVTNVRDLGGVSVCGNRGGAADGEAGRMVTPGLVYRGGELAGATERDCHKLFEDLGIRCVIDLRCGWERRAKPDVQVPGVENLHIPFYDLDIVGIEYTEPAAGTLQVGRDVACDPDSFYRSLSNPLTAGQMRKAMDVIFGHALEGEPVYVHCSGGKDRAGTMALLVLAVLGASRQDILEDYLLTNVARDKQYDQMLARFLRFSNGDEQRARELVESHRARPENLQAFYEGVQERYGSLLAFVRDQLGFHDERIARVRAGCTTVA